MPSGPGSLEVNRNQQKAAGESSYQLCYRLLPARVDLAPRINPCIITHLLCYYSLDCFWAMCPVFRLDHVEEGAVRMTDEFPWRICQRRGVLFELFTKFWNSKDPEGDTVRQSTKSTN